MAGEAGALVVLGRGDVRLDVRAAPEGSAGAEAAARIGGDGSGAPVIENEYLRVEYDTARSCIASIIDRTTGRELVNQDAVVGFDQYVYDEYTSAGGFNHQSNKTSTSTRQELLGSRSLPRRSVVLEAADDGVEQRLVVEFSARGVDRARTTLRLRRGESLLRIEHRLDKPMTRTKESAYFAFPFAMSRPEVRYEITGGATGGDLPQVPGAPRHMRAIRDWVSMDSAEDGSVAWVTRNAPLVEPEAIALPYAPFPDSTAPREPGTVYSWVHNNVWDTNFPIEQAFETTFEYAVGVPGGSGRSGAALGAATAAAVVHPPVVVPARGGPDAREVPAQGELVKLDADGPSGRKVRVVAVAAGRTGAVLVKLQSFAAEPTTVRVSLPGIGVGAARSTSYLENGGEELRVRDGAAHVRLAPWDVTAVALTA